MAQQDLGALLAQQNAPWPPPEWSEPSGMPVAPTLAPEPAPVEAANIFADRAPDPVPALDVPSDTPWPPPEWSQTPEPTPEPVPINPDIAPAATSFPPASLQSPAAPALDSLPRAPFEPQEEPAPEPELTPQERIDGLVTPEERQRLLRQPPDAQTAAIDEERAAVDEALRESAREQQTAIDRLNALAIDRDRRESNERVFRAASERTQQQYQQIIDQVDALAEQEVDPDRWWGNRSTGQKIAAFAAAALGGWNASFTGGRNLGLETVERFIDRDIDAQKANLAQRRGLLQDKAGLVGRLMDAGMSEFQAVEAARIAAWSQVEKELQTKAAMFDPQGTAFARAQRQLLDVRGRRAAAEARAKQQLFDNNLARDKFDEEKRQAREAERARRAALAEQRAARQQRERELAAQARREEEAALAKLSAAEAKEVRELGIGAAPQAAGKDASGKPIVDYQPLRNNDGSIYKAPDQESARLLRSQKAAVDSILPLLDNAIRLRHDKGWSSDLVRSPEWRELQALWSEIALSKKDLDKLGVLAGPDVELIGKSLGSADFTESRDPLAGMIKARENMTLKLNKTLRVNNYSGEPITYPKMYSREIGGDMDTEAETQGVREARTLASREGRSTVVGERPQDIELAAAAYKRYEPSLTDAEARQLAERELRRATPWKRSLDELAEEAVSAPAARRQEILDTMQGLAGSETGERKAEIERAIQTIQATGTPRTPVF